MQTLTLRPPRTLSRDQIHTDWRHSPTNRRPAGWTYPHDQPSSTALRVAGRTDVPSGRVLLWDFAGGSRDRYTAAYSGWSAYDGSAASQEQEVYGEFEVMSDVFTSDGVHSFLCGLMARVGGTGSSERGFRLVLHQLTAGGSRELLLNAYTGGAYDQLTSIPFDWQVGVVYCLLMRLEGPRIRAKAWELGTAEPAGWLIDYTLINPTHIAYTGPPGLQFHEGAVVACHRWGAGLRGQTAPRDYATPRAAWPRQRWYDFSADALGSVPAGFSPLFQPHAGRFRVVAEPGGPAGRALEFTGQAGARGMWGLFLDEVGIVGDVELYAEMYVPAASVVPNCRFGGLIARAGDAGGLWTGWGNDSRSDTGGTLFATSNYDRWVGSATSTTLAGDSGFTTTAGLLKGAWTCLRIKVVKNQMFARYWPRGSAEPSTWFRTTDPANLVPTSATAVGRVGVYTQEDRTIRWGCVGVGLDGMPAPSAPLTPPTLPSGAVLALESRSLDALSPGDPVGTWPGIVGSASASTAPQRPTFQRAGLLPVVEFDGVSNVLDPALVLGNSLTLVYVSIPVADYGTPVQDGKRITPNVGNSGVFAYTGRDKVESPWTNKWALQYAAPAFLNDGVMAVGQVYAAGLAVDPAGYTSYFGRAVARDAAKAEAIGDTVLRIGGTANQRLVAFYAWPRRLSTAEYQQAHDYIRAWLAGYGTVFP